MRAAPSPGFGEMPEGDEKTTWVPSSEPMDPGELTSWISSKSDQPDFERTESRGARRPPPTPDPRDFGYDASEGTAVIKTPIRRKGMPTPEPAPRRRKRGPEAPLPTPEPAPRRRAQQRNQPTPAPKAPRPPTPEPAPPRRGRRAMDQADEEPSLTVPRTGMTGRTPMPTPMPGRTPTPTPSPMRQESVPRPAMPLPAPPVPQPPVPVPDHWTPAPSGEHRDALYGGQHDDPSTEVGHEELDAHGFPYQPDVPSTVVSEDNIDEVPPTPSPLPHIPNDAPTVVRPDLAMIGDMSDKTLGGTPISNQDETIGNLLEPIAGHTADVMQAYAEQPPGEPTVALPPPSRRKNTQVRQPTPEPAPDALPSGASYSPPTADNIPNPGLADKKRRAATPPPAPKSVKKPPVPGASGARSGPSPRSGNSKSGPKKLPKNASIVSGKDPFPTEVGGISNLTLVYGAVFVLGLLLVVGAFVLGIVILAFTSS